MKKKSQIFYLVLIFICLYSCSSELPQHKHEQPKPVAYTVLQKSPLFNKNNISFSLDSIDNDLYITLSIKKLKNFPFPVNTQYKDTLYKTAFTFTVYCNNKIIQSDYRLLKNSFR